LIPTIAQVLTNSVSSRVVGNAEITAEKSGESLTTGAVLL
jgi:hypothetical protein